MKNKTKYEKNNDYDLILKAMEIYMQEYIHRDTHMWSQIYKFFLSTLVIIILPNITSRIGIKIPPMLDHKHWVFPLLGIIMSFVFLYNSFNLVKRFQICSQTYDKLIKQLPQNLRRETIFPKKSKILKQIHPYVVPSIMFFCLFFLSILFFTIYLPFA